MGLWYLEVGGFHCCCCCQKCVYWFVIRYIQTWNFDKLNSNLHCSRRGSGRKIEKHHAHFHINGVRWSQFGAWDISVQNTHYTFNQIEFDANLKLRKRERYYDISGFGNTLTEMWDEFVSALRRERKRELLIFFLSNFKEINKLTSIKWHFLSNRRRNSICRYIFFRNI